MVGDIESYREELNKGREKRKVEIFSYQFFQNALWASLLTAIVAGIIGSYIVVRRMAFMSGGITHASFGGLGLGVYAGFEPMVGAACFAILSALGIGYVSRAGHIRQDSAIAGIWSLGMAVGVLFMAMTPGYTTNLSAYLFGNILLVTKTDLLLLLCMAVMLVLFFSLAYRSVLYTAFDADFARTRGRKVALIENLMLVAIALGIVLSIRLIGIMLLMSMLTLPQSTMNLFTDRFKHIIFGSVVLALIGSAGGLLGSYYLGLPSGAFIVLLLVLFFGAGKMISSLHHIPKSRHA
ncbi:Manganese transport system membrane protein mntB [Porphyromonas macacae]|uniref:Manganese transport system membrane protein mntB n=1 Tax=Porphyromonas macacae TaxID=28115 RepID=A0A379DHF3_9PORP|nr:Manganese transport system membrane protein mntB [Porphyromonas macacae]